MIFKPRQKRQKLEINIDINNCNIERVKEIVFLGTILDETTLFTYFHVEQILGDLQFVFKDLKSLIH